MLYFQSHREAYIYFGNQNSPKRYIFGYGIIHCGETCENNLQQENYVNKGGNEGVIKS